MLSTIDMYELSYELLLVGYRPTIKQVIIIRRDQVYYDDLMLVITIESNYYKDIYVRSCQV